MIESFERTEERQDYSLDFLKGPDFQIQMATYIRTHFAHMLDKEDLKLLSQGSPDALSALSEKMQASYREKLAARMEASS